MCSTSSAPRPASGSPAPSRAPTPAQAGAWEAIAQGRHALVVAPTGSGKTLAAFLWAIDRLAHRDPTRAVRHPRALHLAAEGARRRRGAQPPRPLVGVTQTAKRLGASPPSIRVGVRSGDTPQAERRALSTDPPEILITTPESLFLMLTSQARETLRNVEHRHRRRGARRRRHQARRAPRPVAGAPRRAARAARAAHRAVRHREAGRRRSRASSAAAPPSRRGAARRRRPSTSASSCPSRTCPTPTSAAAGPRRTLDPRGSAAGAVFDPDDPLPPRTGSIWPHVESAIIDLVLQHRSSIVFANSRRLAERLTARLNEMYEERLEREVAEETETAEELAMAGRHRPARHAGRRREPGAERIDAGRDASCSRARTTARSARSSAPLIEDDLKSGRLRCVVATSSLELGIDMGAVDLVVQVEAPPSVASGLQRVGRAGHQVGEISTRRRVPQAPGRPHPRGGRGRPDGRAARSSRCGCPPTRSTCSPSRRSPPSRSTPIDVEAWFDAVRRSAPFAALPRSAYEAMLDLLAGRYPSDEFAELRPRIVWDRDAGTITGRPGAQRLAVTSGGTIPDRGLFGVFMVGGDKGGARVGELDEEMVYESRVGDVFSLGATSWRIQEITHDRVHVLPAFGEPGRRAVLAGRRPRPPRRARPRGRRASSAPSPRPDAEDCGRHRRADRPRRAGGAQPRALRRRAGGGHRAACRPTARSWSSGSATSSATGGSCCIPRTACRCMRRGRWPINARLARALRHRRRGDGGGRRHRAAHPRHGRRAARRRPLRLRSRRARVHRHDGGQRLRDLRVPLPRVRRAGPAAAPLQPGQALPALAAAAARLAAARRGEEVPDLPDHLRDDPRGAAGRLRPARAEGAGGEARVAGASAWSRSRRRRRRRSRGSLLFGYVGGVHVRGRQPARGAARRRPSRSTRRCCPSCSAGWSCASCSIPAVLERIEQRAAAARSRAPAARASRAPPTCCGCSDRSRSTRSPARLDDGEGSAVSPDRRARRCCRSSSTPAAPSPAQWAGTDWFAAIEDASRLRDALGVPLPIGVPVAFVEPVADPLGDLVGRYARTHAPFAAQTAAARLGLGVAVVTDTLRRLADERRVTEGEFRPGGSGSEWCDVEVLRRLRRRSLAALRREVEPVDQGAFARFLPEWQHVTGGGRGSLSGVDGVAQVIEQLAGVPVPASAWESLVLPRRVRDYRPGMLDELTATGEVVWSGAGRIAGQRRLGRAAPRRHRSRSRCRSPRRPSTRRAGARGARGARQRRRLLLPAARRHGRAPPIDGKLQEALWNLVWAGPRHQRHLRAGARAHRQRRQRPSRAAAHPASPGVPRSGAARSCRSRAGAADRRGPMGDPAAARARHHGAGGRGGRVPPRPLRRRHARLRAVGAGARRLRARLQDARRARGGRSRPSRLLRRAPRRRAVLDVRHRRPAPLLQPRRRRAAGGTGRPSASRRPIPRTPTAPRSPGRPAETEGGHRPGRKAGALVVLVDGALVAYLERGGRTVLLLHRRRGGAARHRGGAGRAPSAAAVSRDSTIEKIDGVFAARHPVRRRARAGGLQPEPEGACGSVADRCRRA